MEKSGKVKNRGGITTVGKDPNLVSWDLGYRRDENDVVLDVFITFSSKARAKTGRGDKQDSHTSAYALHLAQTMKIVKDTVPKEENDFRGLNNLVNEMALIPQRDFFLLEKFNVMPKHTEELVPAEFKNNLYKQVEKQQEIIINTVEALDQAINSAQMYQESSTSLAPTDFAGQRILNNLNNTNTKLLEDLKLGARRDYSLNVATKAAEKLLNYQNAAPYVTFSEISTNDEDEKVFRKAEGSRVRKALGVLMAYSLSDLSVVQDFANEEDLLDEEVLSDEKEILDKGVENIDAKDLAASTSSAAQQHSTLPLRQQPKRGKGIFPSLNEGLMKQNVVYQTKSPDELAKEAKNKKERETEKIVEAICNLLYYPPLNDEDLENISAANLQRERTNDINVFCYVLTRHLAMILETFNKLAELEAKDAIINRFLDKMLDDWKAVISKTQIGQLNKLATFDNKKESMKNDINTALRAWEQESHRIREEQKKPLILSSDSNDNDSTGNSHSQLNFSLSYPSTPRQEKGEGFQQSPNVRAAAAASSQRRAVQALMPKSPSELQQRDLNQSRTTTKNRGKPNALLPLSVAAAARASADRREKGAEATRDTRESSQNKEIDKTTSNTSSPNKKGTTPY